jgi:adenine-specific DNA-methyltransferase
MLDSKGINNLTFRYLGSKARLVKQIASHIPAPVNDAYFIDAFCGTGAIAEVAAELGWNVKINDNMHSAVITAGARLISHEQAKFKKLGGYLNVIDMLNAVAPHKGFIWSTYSPASAEVCGIERKYFTEENAARIDAIRNLIAEWKILDKIDGVEERLLIADLLGALNRVANIAGTFGCFLSRWTPQSQDRLNMRCRELKDKSINVIATVGDVFDIPHSSNDVMYLDPPYTKRQYASYYHILETVAIGDEPTVVGVAGLRPWQKQASDFCYKTRALKTLSRLVGCLQAKKILLSYSSEGHISMHDMQLELSTIRTFVMHSLGTIGRYRPNKVASNTANNVSEYLVILDYNSLTHKKNSDLRHKAVSIDLKECYV